MLRRAFAPCCAKGRSDARTGADVESVAPGTSEPELEPVEPIIVPIDQIPQHPDDIIHTYKYETLVRLRISLFVFFSLALTASLSLGRAMHMFFSMMVTEELDLKVVLEVILVPPMLLCAAVFIDNLVDVALDAMAWPSLCLFRACVTTSLRTRFPAWSTRDTELWFVRIWEAVPIITGTVGMVMISAFSTSFFIRFLIGYLAGGVLNAYLLAVVYIISHIHVFQSEFAEARMSVLWRYMGHVGELKHVRQDIQEVAVTSDKRNSWRTSAVFALASIGIVAAMLLVVVLCHNIYGRVYGVQLITVSASMFALLMLSIICMALVLTSSFPRLLGWTFWVTLAFIALISLGLTIFVHQDLPSKDIKHERLVWSKGASGYNQPGAEDGHLPLDFQVSRSPGYPICNHVWGNSSLWSSEHVNLLDLALLGQASYAATTDRKWALEAFFNGTDLEDVEVLENEKDEQIGSSMVVEFPKQKVRVMVVRGTAITSDVYADLNFWSGIVVLQAFGYVIPVLQALPVDMVQSLLDFSDTSEVPFLARTRKLAEKHKKEARQRGFHFMVTGHSLGGAITGILASKLGIDGVGFSPPGLRFQMKRMDMDDDSYESTFTVVKPRNDVVPFVDEQRGMIQWIKCDAAMPTCHKLVKTTCELWTQCGDPRGRDYRQSCSQWHNVTDIKE